MHIVGQGIYTFSEAARLTGVSTRRISAWFLGGESTLGQVIRSDYAEHGPSAKLISFLDLIDTLIIGQLRDHGLSLQYLRKIHAALIKELHSPHPFGRQEILTDGKRVFIHVADRLGDEKLKEVFTNRLAFPEILLPYLEQIDYHPRKLLPVRWNISEGVVVDPQRRFGKPIIDANGIPTAVLAAALNANNSNRELVAEWYGVSPGDVELASQFERGLTRKIA